MNGQQTYALLFEEKHFCGIDGLNSLPFGVTRIRICIDITIVIAITMAVAAMAVIGSSWMAGRAGAAVQITPGDESVRFVFPPIGVARDQTLTYSFFNPNEEGSEPVRAQVTLYDEQGNVVWRSEEVKVPEKAFRITYTANANFWTSSTNYAVAAIGTITGAEGTGARCSAAMQLVDNATGKTTVYYSAPGTRVILR